MQCLIVCFYFVGAILIPRTYSNKNEAEMIPRAGFCGVNFIFNFQFRYFRWYVTAVTVYIVLKKMVRKNTIKLLNKIFCGIKITSVSILNLTIYVTLILAKLCKLTGRVHTFWCGLEIGGLSYSGGAPKVFKALNNALKQEYPKCGLGTKCGHQTIFLVALRLLVELAHIAKDHAFCCKFHFSMPQNLKNLLDQSKILLK